jgi:ribosomal protein S1
LQKVNSPLETIAEEASPDKVVKEIITELNNEHHDSAIEGKRQGLVDSQPSKSEDLKTSQAEPQSSTCPTLTKISPLLNLELPKQLQQLRLLTILLF